VPELAQAHSLACHPSAAAVGVGAARADMGSVPVAMRDVPVAAEDVAGDKTDTRSVEAAVAAATWRMHVVRMYF